MDIFEYWIGISSGLSAVSNLVNIVSATGRDRLAFPNSHAKKRLYQLDVCMRRHDGVE